MSATTGFKTKKTKGDDLYPPQEIRENTKARRAWLAAEVEKLANDPTKEAKIVGTGSYQRVSVWNLSQVAGRTRLAGTCQFCGNRQVVKEGVLVLHGYTRPGDGYVYGRCPGMDLPALNERKTETEAWLVQFTAERDAAAEALATAQTAHDKARTAVHENREWGAMYSRPDRPRATRDGAWRKVEPTAEAIEAYRAALAAWAATHPASATLHRAIEVLSEARAKHRQLDDLVTHLAALLASGVHGTPLVVEVVA